MRKKAFAFVFAFLTALSPCLTARAQGDMNDMVEMVLSNQDGMLNLVSEAEDGFDLEWSCLVTNAEVYDLLTGLPANPAEIEAGEFIRVFQAVNSPVVWINCWEDGAAAFKATVSENIQYQGDMCNFLTGDEKYRVTLTSDTVIYDPAVGFIGPADIGPGCEMFVWVDMVTASCPAQAYPAQVVLIK